MGKNSFVLACVISVAAACGGADPAGSDAGPVDGAIADAPDPSVLFEADRILEIEIEMDPADFETLRNQTRTLIDTLFGDCLAQPFLSPFTSFPGDVTIDGVTVTQSGVRKKGFLGSMSVERPSLKIKFDEFVLGQEFLGLDRLTLNNVRQDPSFVHTCLAYGVFHEAGRPAPRCNFAHVTVNGEDLGLYVHVESVDKNFLRRHFVDDEGTLYEGTLSDFRPEWVNTFEKKTNEMDPDRSDLDAMVAALALPDDQLLGALDPLIEVDDFLTFWAVEVLVGHWDGYANNTNNFFLYHHPGDGKLHFMPWGADAVFEPGVSFGQGAAGAITAVAATGLLARRLYLHPTTRDLYVDRLNELLDTAWDEDRLLDEIDRMETLIAPLAEQTSNPSDWRNAVDDVRVFVMQRRQQILDELAAGPPLWTAPLRDPFCFEDIGDATGTFTTSWGTIGGNPWLTGSGTMSFTIDGTPYDLSMVGANSGWEEMPQGPPRALVQMVAPIGDGTYAVVVLGLDPARFSSGQTVAVDWGASFGYIFRYDPATMSGSLMALLMGGAGVDLDQASTTNGQSVSGSYSLDVAASPW